MKSYGQYCPLARASEILSNRWSLLMLRDLTAGINRFSDIQKGVPLMSPSLLSRRLKEFETFGLIEKKKEGPNYTYNATPSALELKPVIYLLAAWGQRWVRNKLLEDDLDVKLLMWDMSLRIDPKSFPAQRQVIAFEYSDGSSLSQQDWDFDKWWLVIEEGESELCLKDPGHDVDLFILTDLRTMTHLWMGDISPKEAQNNGILELQGSKSLIETFPDWFVLSVHAKHNRPPAPLDLTEFLKASGIVNPEGNMGSGNGRVI